MKFHWASGMIDMSEAVERGRASFEMLSTGLRLIPPPCLGCGSEAYWIPIGVSWHASRVPLGRLLRDPWGFLGALDGSLGGPCELWGNSWGPLKEYWGLLVWFLAGYLGLASVSENDILPIVRNATLQSSGSRVKQPFQVFKKN